LKIQILTQYYFPEIGAASTRWTDYSRLIAGMGHGLRQFVKNLVIPILKRRKRNYYNYIGV